MVLAESDRFNIPNAGGFCLVSIHSITASDIYTRLSGSAMKILGNVENPRRCLCIKCRILLELLKCR